MSENEELKYSARTPLNIYTFCEMVVLRAGPEDVVR